MVMRGEESVEEGWSARFKGKTEGEGGWTGEEGKRECGGEVECEVKGGLEGEEGRKGGDVGEFWNEEKRKGRERRGWEINIEKKGNRERENGRGVQYES